jgi:uncharacterized membrane protein YhaH (DUF805 family)
MLGYLDFLFLSYSGRIGRTTYWVSLLVLGAVEIGAILLLLQLSHGHIGQLSADPQTLTQEVLTRVVIPVTIVSLLFLYPTYAVTTKRWHDRDKSGWWSLIGFVPIIGGIWYLIELGFLGGSDGANSYGSR